MLNQCQFIGNLGADPEVKSFTNGGRIANLRLAVTSKWKDKQSGEKRERTEWISVVLQSEGLVGIAEKYLRKGSKIFVQGEWRGRKWTDQSGADRYSTEINVGMGGALTMLDGPPQTGERKAGADTDPAPSGSWGGDESRVNDDDPMWR